MYHLQYTRIYSSKAAFQETLRQLLLLRWHDLGDSCQYCNSHWAFLPWSATTLSSGQYATFYSRFWIQLTGILPWCWASLLLPKRMGQSHLWQSRWCQISSTPHRRLNRSLHIMFSAYAQFSLAWPQVWLVEQLSPWHLELTSWSSNMHQNSAKCAFMCRMTYDVLVWRISQSNQGPWSLNAVLMTL